MATVQKRQRKHITITDVVDVYHIRQYNPVKKEEVEAPELIQGNIEISRQLVSRKTVTYTMSRDEFRKLAKAEEHTETL